MTERIGSEMEARLPWRGLAILAAGLLLLLFARSMCGARFFDLDEHQFVAPPLLLDQQGKMPYADYPYFHMPNLVYLYAAVMQFFPYKLLVARTLSALCGTGTALLVFVAGWRALSGFTARGRWVIAGGMVAVLICSRIFTYTSGLAWNHDAPVVCAVGAFMLMLGRDWRNGAGDTRWWRFGLAGLLVGMATGIRLTFAPLALVCGLAALISPGVPWRRRWAGFAAGALGVLIALLPALVALRQSPSQFLFGNWGYPLLYRHYVEAGPNPHGLTIAAKLLYCLGKFLTDPADAVILGLFVGAAVCAWRRRHRDAGPWRPLVLALAFLAALWIGAIAPAQIQWQYLFPLLPFIIIATMVMIGSGKSGGDQTPEARAVRWGGWVLVVGCCALVTAAVGLPRWYWGIIDLPRPWRWTPVVVHERGVWLREHLAAAHVEKQSVLTIDPVVPLEAGIDVYPEFATGRLLMHVGPYATATVLHEQHLAWGPELERLLAERPPAAILYDVGLEELVPGFVKYAREQGMVAVDSPAAGHEPKYRLWVRPIAPVQ